MKITKILSVFLAIIMLTGCLSIMPVSAEANDVYKVGTGGTYTKINEAVAAIVKANLTSATIEFVSDYETGNSMTDGAHPDTTITYTSNGKYTLTFGNLYEFGGPVVLKDIKLATSAEKQLFACGYTFVADTGVETTGSSKVSISGASYSNGNGGATGTNVTIKSGTWTNVYTNCLVGGTVSGESVTNIRGGTITNLRVGGTDREKTSANNGAVNVNISGGTITSIRIGHTNTATAKTSFSAPLTFNINGGTVKTNFGVYSSAKADFTFDEVVVNAENASEDIAWLSKLTTKAGSTDYKDKFEFNLAAYVSASGDDAKSGWSSDVPVKTINKAIGNINTLLAKVDSGTATVKIMGTVSQAAMTETAHTTAITYTGYDSSAELSLTGSFTMSGPTIFKNLKITVASEDTRYIYMAGHSLTMDVGLNISGDLRIAAQYGANHSKIDLTINSGTYKQVLHSANGGTINGNVDIKINSLDETYPTTVGTLYVGGGWAVKDYTTTGTTNVTVNDGTINSFYIGSTAASVVTFGDAVNIKINGGALSGANYFGAKDENAAKTVFAEAGCVVDFSDYVNTGVYEANSPNLFYTARMWKQLLNSRIATETDCDDYKASFTVKETVVKGMQVSTDTKSVRFVAGICDINNTTASITVVAKYGNNEQKTFIKDITHAYSSVLANPSGVDTPTEITAKSVNANYLIAYTITGLPTDVGEITFEVTSTVNGVDSEVQTFKHTPTNQQQS